MGGSKKNITQRKKNVASKTTNCNSDASISGVDNSDGGIELCNATTITLNIDQLREIIHTENAKAIDVIKSQLSEMKTDIANRIDYLENNLKDSSQQTKHEIISGVLGLIRTLKNTTSAAAASTSTPHVVIHDVLNEQKDLEDRKGNLVVLGMPESQKLEEKDRLIDDGVKLQNLFQTLDYTKPLIDYKRIGRKGEKPRPVILKFKPTDMDKRTELLTLAKNLSGLHADDEKKKYFIKPDLTRKQQLIEKELYEEVKRKRINDTGNEYYYFIRNGAIIEKRKKAPE